MTAAVDRGVAARIGITALNLLTPGLGLLRVQRPRAAALFILLPPGLVLGVGAVFALGPALSFRAWTAIMLAVLLAACAAFLGSMILSWRHSRFRAEPIPWWSHWYALAAIALLVTVGGGPAADWPRSYYRQFYIPSESMMPTFQVDDRLVASMRGPGALQRGDVILFDVGNAIYIQRLAALPGDRIEIIGGVVFLNGTQVPQTVVAQETAVNSQGEPSRRLFEQFPGEARAHQILDSGPARFDDMPEQLVPPGHVFVLGDNRDNSADSRMPRDEMGVGLLPISDIRGRALFYLWGPSGRMGEPLTP